jgi:hypothetical protein
MFRELVRRFWVEDCADDIIEYGLLTLGVGLAAFAGFLAVENAIGNSYPVWDTNQQDLWEPPDPGAFE